MNSLLVEEMPRATGVDFTNDELCVTLSDGRRLAVPIAWFPRLAHANAAQRSHYELLGGGQGIHWPDLDEDVSVAGLVAGRRSVELDATRH